MRRGENEFIYSIVSLLSMNSAELEAWLVNVNRRYRDEEMPHKRRPFQAYSDYSREFNCAFLFDSPLATSIFEWFKSHSEPEAHMVGALHTDTFYFDAYFWPVNIPIGYGRFALNMLECLSTMPKALKVDLQQNKQDMGRLAIYWADCCDYGYGLNDLEKDSKLSPRAMTFLLNADKELIGATSQLTTPRPNPKAILACRMACEIFLKTALIQELNPSEQKLKKLGHKIDALANACHGATSVDAFKEIALAAAVFPDVSERYDGKDRPLSVVWNAIAVAQFAAATVIRLYTDRDMRKNVLSHAK